MFTGIIKAVGTVVTAGRRGGGIAFSVKAPGFSEGLAIGDSVAVNGVCQTLEEIRGEEIFFTAVGETLRKTTFPWFSPGDKVNLEPAISAGTPLGGHFVQGHVDGIGRVVSISTSKGDKMLVVRLNKDASLLVVPKGSIAIDGVSLTVAEKISFDTVKIAIVPFTVKHTIVRYYRPGRRVNVEYDVVGKYVQAFLKSSDRSARKSLLDLNDGIHKQG